MAEFQGIGKVPRMGFSRLTSALLASGEAFRARLLPHGSPENHALCALASSWGRCWLPVGRTVLFALRFKHLIVRLDVALKGPFPLVGESELARESEIACFGVFHLLEIYIRK
jgi:hypothetical protein